MIYILSQAIQTGKTTQLMDIVQDNNHIGGFLSPTMDNTRKLYNIYNKEYIEFEKKAANHNTISVGRFHFIRDSFSTASQWVQEHYDNKNIQLIIIDEIGKLELQNEGFHTLTEKIMTMDWTTTDVLLIIRDFLLNEVTDKYNIIDFRLVSIEDIIDITTIP